MLAGLPLVVAAAAAALNPISLPLLAHPVQCVAMHCRRRVRPAAEHWLLRNPPMNLLKSFLHASLLCRSRQRVLRYQTSIDPPVRKTSDGNKHRECGRTRKWRSRIFQRAARLLGGPAEISRTRCAPPRAAAIRQRAILGKSRAACVVLGTPCVLLHVLPCDSSL